MTERTAYHECAAQTPPDRRWRITRAMSKLLKNARWHAYLLYCRLIYRHHMRFIHKHGKHWWRHFNLIDGPEFDKCEWCGAIRHDDGTMNP